MDEDEKHAAQTAFLSAENVSHFYEQIIRQGYFGENLTRQIAEETTPEVKQPEIEQPEIQREHVENYYTTGSDIELDR
jgi:hypothetical protein